MDAHVTTFVRELSERRAVNINSRLQALKAQGIWSAELDLVRMWVVLESVQSDEQWTLMEICEKLGAIKVEHEAKYLERFLQGFVFEKLGKLDEAKRYHLECLRLDPNFVPAKRALSELGQQVLRKNREAQAKPWFKKLFGLS